MDILSLAGLWTKWREGLDRRWRAPGHAQIWIDMFGDIMMTLMSGRTPYVYKGAGPDDLAGLPIDLDHVLKALCLSLVREPKLSRATLGGLVLLQRHRARKQLAADGKTAILDELEQLRAIEAAVKDIAASDSAEASRYDLPPPDIDTVEACMRKHVYGDAPGHVANFEVIVSGYSKQSTLFDWVNPGGDIDKYVLRRDHYGLPGTSVTEEYPIMAALHRRGFPAPDTVFVETGNARIPEPFMVMRRADGACIGSAFLGTGGSTFDPTPILAKLLAELHNIPVSELGVHGYSDVSFSRDMLLSRVRHWRDLYLEYKITVSPILDKALAFLEDEVESGLQPGAVVHGDACFYNILFKDDKLVCLLDWELVHLGSPVWDLAYAKDAVEAFRPFCDFLELYEQYGGPRPSRKALLYYDVFRLFRSAALCTKGISRFNKGDNIGLDLIHLLSTNYPTRGYEIRAAMECFHNL